MSDDELDLVTTDRLWGAVTRRFDAALLVTLRDKNRDEEGFVTYWAGSAITAIGLAHEGIRDIQERRTRREPAED